MKTSQTRVGLLSLTLSTLLLSLLLVACGSDSTPVPNGLTTGAATTGPATTVNTVPTTQAAATTADATTAAGSPTANPNFTPVGLAASPTAATTQVAVIDANLKGAFTIWDALPSADAGTLRDQVTAFGKAYPGVKVNLQHYDGDELLYAAQQAAKTNKLPDLFLVPADYRADLQAAKALQPADKALDKTLLSGFADKALAGSQESGTQWGVPFTYSGTSVMLYNKKLVANPPTTWKELGQTVRPLYNGNLKQIGLALDVNEPFFLTSLLGGFGGGVLDAQNKPTLDTPQMVSSLTFIDQLLNDKTVRGDSRLKDNQIEYAFRDGRLGIYIGPDSLIGQYATAIAPTDTEAKLDLGVAPLPKIDSTGQSPAPFNDDQTFFLGTGTSGDHLKAVSTFLGWLAQPSQQTAILNKLHLLPATKAFLASDTVKNNPVWSGLLTQLDQSKPQPSALEMSAVSDALRPNLEAVVAGTLKPADAAKQMQQMALDKVSKLATK